MCYLSEESSIIDDAEVQPFVFYTDTAANLAGGLTPNEINLKQLSMTTITDLSAIQCPTFSVSVTGSFPTFEFQEVNNKLIINVDVDTVLQVYDLTYTVEVASESYSFDYPI